MLVVTFGNHRYDLPARWSELTSEHGRQFTALCSAMSSFESGEIPFWKFRVLIVAALLNIRFKKLFDKPEGTLYENFYRIAEQIDFPFTLSRAADGSESAAITILLSRNLLPKIGMHRGYTFDHHADGELECTLTAEQYIDALALMQAYGAGKQLSSLQSLAETLYPGLKGAKTDKDTLLAVYYNFRGILQYIQSLPSYRLIFATLPSEGGSPANPVGMSGTIYTLAKLGYGDINTVKSLNLFTYLDLLLQQSVDTIKTYVGMKLKPNEIADRMNLPLDLIFPYTSN